MEIKREYDFYDLLDNCWSGALNTLKVIQENDKENDFMDYLESLYGENIPTLTEVNDLLWFEPESIYEALEIENDSEDDVEEETESEEIEEIEE